MEDDLETLADRLARVDDDIARETRPSVRLLAEQADRTDGSSTSPSSSFSDRFESE